MPSMSPSSKVRVEITQVTWATVAAEKAATFGSLVGKGMIPGQCTYQHLNKSIKQLQKKYSAKRSTRWFTKLEPIVAHLRTFSSAIGYFTQADPTISSLVWGSIKLVLDVSVLCSPPPENRLF